MPRSAHSLFMLLVLGLMAPLPSPARAEIATVILYQGFVRDASGNPLNSPTNLDFSIFTVATKGAALWTETQSAVPVTAGIFSVQLGSVTPFPAALFSNQEISMV